MGEGRHAGNAKGLLHPELVVMWDLGSAPNLTCHHFLGAGGLQDNPWVTTHTTALRSIAMPK